MTDTTALPTAPAAPASGQPPAELLEQTSTSTTTEGTTPEDGKKDDEQGERKEKTPEQRERERMQRGIDRKTRQAAEARAENQQLRAELERLRGGQRSDTIPPDSNDDEPLTLSRSQLQQMVKSEAEKLAPTLRQQQSEIEQRTAVVEKLEKGLGKERFDALAEDLDEALGGLTDRAGAPKGVTQAIFAADDPQAVIQYLADPENADEAEALGRMDPVRAGRAIAKLETKLERAKAESKPQRSSAPQPIEPSRGQGGAPGTPDPSSPGYMDWKLKQLGSR